MIISRSNASCDAELRHPHAPAGGVARVLAGACCAGLLALTQGCLEPPDVEVAPRVVALGVVPAETVDLGAPVAVLLSGGEARMPSDDLPFVVSIEDGSAVPSRATLQAGGTEVRVEPVPSWPPGKTLEVQLGALADVFGRPVSPAEGGLLFSTSPVLDPEPGSTTVRSPLPARRAPLNLRWLAAVLSPNLEPDRTPATLELTAGDGAPPVHARVERVAEGGVVLARLAEHRGSCDPLCPGTEYRVSAGASHAAAAGPRGSVLTATITDVTPPSVTSTSVSVRGDRVIVEVIADEPVLVFGRVTGGSGESWPLDAPLIASEEVFVEAAGALAAGSTYTFELELEDVAGNRLPRRSIGVELPGRVVVSISELVPAPIRDWGDSDGLGTPLDPYPGSGTVSDADEWIELVNLSDYPLDLERAGLVVRVIDSSPTETWVNGAPSLYFGDGGSRERWWPGEALVMRPRGAIAHRGFVVELVSGAVVLDRVEVGEVDGADSRTGSPPDLQHEALARDPSGGFRWCLPTPGDPVPGPCL